MKNFRTFMIEHKQMVCILGLLFIVILECCVFPVGRITDSSLFSTGIINLVTAIYICKCLGEIVAVLFVNATWMSVILINFGITILGMTVRYFLEYGEISNIYNFTLKNIVIHILIIMLLSMMFWMQTKRKNINGEI